MVVDVKDFKEEIHAPTRFATVTDSIMDELVTNNENLNTMKNTAWAVRVFEHWRNEKNCGIPELVEMTSEQFNFLLGKFIVEARKKDWTETPPRSLYLITCGLLLRFLRDNNVRAKIICSILV